MSRGEFLLSLLREGQRVTAVGHASTRFQSSVIFRACFEGFYVLFIGTVIALQLQATPYMAFRGALFLWLVLRILVSLFSGTGLSLQLQATPVLSFRGALFSGLILRVSAFSS